MRQGERGEELVDHVEAVAGHGVLVRLRHEGIDVELAAEVFAPAAAREEHEELLRGHDVLTAQQARAIGRELRLSAPLQEGESHGQQCKACLLYTSPSPRDS